MNSITIFTVVYVQQSLQPAPAGPAQSHKISGLQHERVLDICCINACSCNPGIEKQLTERLNSRASHPFDIKAPPHQCGRRAC